jgi:hypothetical protein
MVRDPPGPASVVAIRSSAMFLPRALKISEPGFKAGPCSQTAKPETGFYARGGYYTRRFERIAANRRLEAEHG